MIKRVVNILVSIGKLFPKAVGYLIIFISLLGVIFYFYDWRTLSIKNINDFFGQLFSNFLATIFAGILLYMFLDKKLQDRINKREIIKSLKNLKGELIYNYIIAERLIENEENYLNGNEFSVARYRINNLFDFLNSQPIEVDDKFYSKLSGLISMLQADIFLTDLIFSSNDGNAITSNKKQVIKNARAILLKEKELFVLIEPVFLKYIKIKFDAKKEQINFRNELVSIQKQHLEAGKNLIEQINRNEQLNIDEKNAEIIQQQLDEAFITGLGMGGYKSPYQISNVKILTDKEGRKTIQYDEQ